VEKMLNTLPTVVFTDKILQFFKLTEVSILRAIDKKIKHLITTHRHRICTKICFHILPHGLQTFRAKNNGILVRTSTYKEGIKHGEEKNFDYEGILFHRLEFSEGRRHGQATFFDKYTGEMITTQFKHGKKHGVEKFFIRPHKDRLNEVDAMLLQVTPFTEGQKHGLEIYFDEYRGEMRTTPFKHGQKHGVEIFIRPDKARLLQVTPFTEGQENGEEKHRILQGVLTTMTPYKEGQKHGVEKYFRQVGDMRFHVDAVLGQMIGVLVQASPFKEGQLDGEEKCWNNEGVLTKITQFDQGQKITSSSCEASTSEAHKNNTKQSKKGKGSGF
jgi:antitoxin component YwqK of YwqJK toxin-antitoxin module